jgi:hypothetical protein
MAVATKARTFGASTGPKVSSLDSAVARPVHRTPGVTSFVSSVVAVTLALAQAPSGGPTVAVLPVDAAESELAPADVDALRTTASDALALEGASVVEPLPEDMRSEGLQRADAAWLSRTLAPHGVSHWLVTRVRGQARTYEIELEIWAVGADRPLATARESCAICGQTELRDLVHEEVRTLELAIGSDPAPSEEPPRSLAPRGGSADPSAARSDRRTPDSSLRIPGYATLSAGAVALVAGSTLIALDGREHGARCRAENDTAIDADGDCRYVHRTLGGGISLVLGGVLASAGGITLLALDARRRRRAELSMRIGDRRVALVGRF